ncbi:unnamed protein product [Calicophoron daubneyi]|uniref:Histone-binding protein RBBP4-like N-terminal domain-containing protein n=1 Tax=Calicophoron daubneyi TaxID=300641 RepID=A0AAV2TZQ5_CALDB
MRGRKQVTFDVDLDSTPSGRSKKKRTVDAEREIWSHNIPLLYDLFLSNDIRNNCLTIQWLPGFERCEDGYIMYRFTTGTYTGTKRNFLIVAGVRLTDLSEYERSPLVSERIEVQQKINHTGEVNRTCHIPQNPHIIATQSSTAEILLFDCKKHPKRPRQTGVCKPDLRLRGHEKEGYGLSWNRRRSGHLLSSSDDCTVRLWDINAGPKTGCKYVEPLKTFTGHEEAVSDVSWHPFKGSIFGSVSDDKTIRMWDNRSRSATNVIRGHSDAVTCLSFNWFCDYILATGSLDGSIGMWDLRNLQTPLYALERDLGPVFELHWSSLRETILGSCGESNKLYIWDVSKIGEEVSSEDGAPELLFIHNGHKSKVSDFSWSPDKPWLMCSLAEPGIIQIWQVAKTVYAEDDDPVVCVRQPLSRKETSQLF